MQQLLNAWLNMDFRRQIAVVVATFVMFLAIITMSRIASAPSMTLLYAGLDSGAAGEVVKSLDQRGIGYEIRGDSIFVESSARDELRMTLASEGLPANSSQGYELLDGLSGFGTTSQMFDAAYWRAKEGELARTIAASRHVSSARVHIATNGATPFQRGVEPTASVAITANGTGLTAGQGKAIRFLVASAVAGLSPNDVAVIDSNGNVIGSSDEETSPSGAEDRATILRERVERLLEARVGPGNVVVEVSVETVNETEEIRERRFDPEGRVAISVDTEERTSNSNEQGNPNVTVASNLPDGDGGNNDTSTTQDSETRERINYEVSETERAITRAPGSIRRLTVAVLVNDVVPATPSDAEAGALETRSEEEVNALRELVESAVGFDANRGDVITIKSMALLAASPQGTEVQSSVFDAFELDLMSALQMLVLAIVAIILGLFVVRPILSQDPVPQLADLSGNEDTENGPAALEAPINDAAAEPDFPDIDLSAPLPDLGDLPALPTMNTPGEMGDFSGGNDPVQRLRDMIGDKQEETVEILRTWLEEKEGRA